MSYLLDTHIPLWAAVGSHRLPGEARRLIEERANTLIFSVTSLWEIAIKSGLSRPDFSIDLKNLRLSLHGHGYQELPVTGAHTLALAGLPPIHRDPFDRILVAQAISEGFELIKADRTVARYGAPVRLV